MAQLQWNLNFKRFMDSSLDADYSFDTIKSLKDYLTNPYRYAGQLAYCKEDDSLYILSRDKLNWNKVIGGSSDSLKILKNYYFLPVVTSNTICYCVNDYIDTSVSPNITYKKGFYLWYDDGVNPTEWKLISSSDNKIPEWKIDHDYIVGDKVKYNKYIYECIVAHHSDLTDFNNDKDNWIIELDKYYNLTKNQYDMLVANGTITAENKHLYIVDDNNDYPSEYEMDFTDSKDINVQHNLKCNYPLIRIFDTNNNELYIDVEYYSDNLIILHSEVEISGKVIVNKL